MTYRASNRVLIKRLLSWHKTNYRDYPFRKESGAYRVLVSEILLRQTRAEQVSRVYVSFFEAFPRIEDLAKADHRTVAALVKPLGIKSRISDLIELAQHIEREEGCRIPDDYSKLTALRGVGKYVANSVLVKGYGKHLPLVDSNVNRVIARVLTGENRMKSEIAETAFMNLVRSSSPVELNYAVIDLAHAICTHRNPECMICPINSWCRYAHSSHSSRLIKKGRPFLLSHQRRRSVT